MKMKIIAIGKLGEPYAALEKEFTKRIQIFSSMQVHEIKEIKDKNIKQQKVRESQLIEKLIESDDSLIVLDKEGRLFHSSEEFASCLQTLAQPAFVIGSAVGLDKALKKKARFSFSFSRLTFPHQLFRIMLYEQIYRANCIWKNHPYHK